MSDSKQQAPDKATLEEKMLSLLSKIIKKLEKLSESKNKQVSDNQQLE